MRRTVAHESAVSHGRPIERKKYCIVGVAVRAMVCYVICFVHESCNSCVLGIGRRIDKIDAVFGDSQRSSTVVDSVQLAERLVLSVHFTSIIAVVFAGTEAADYHYATESTGIEEGH